MPCSYVDPWAETESVERDTSDATSGKKSADCNDPLFEFAKELTAGLNSYVANEEMDALEDCQSRIGKLLSSRTVNVSGAEDTISPHARRTLNRLNRMLRYSIDLMPLTAMPFDSYTHWPQGRSGDRDLAETLREVSDSGDQVTRNVILDSVGAIARGNGVKCVKERLDRCLRIILVDISSRRSLLAECGASEADDPALVKLEESKKMLEDVVDTVLDPPVSWWRSIFGGMSTMMNGEGSGQSCHG